MRKFAGDVDAAIGSDARVVIVRSASEKFFSAGADVKRFLTGKNWPMTVLRATEVPPVFSTAGIPATFLLDPDGRVVASETGAAKWDDPSVIAFFARMAGRGG